MRIKQRNHKELKNEQIYKPYVIEISKSKCFDLKDQLNLAAIETIVQLQKYLRKNKQNFCCSE